MESTGNSSEAGPKDSLSFFVSFWLQGCGGTIYRVYLISCASFRIACVFKEDVEKSLKLVMICEHQSLWRYCTYHLPVDSHLTLTPGAG